MELETWNLKISKEAMKKRNEIYRLTGMVKAAG